MRNTFFKSERALHLISSDASVMFLNRFSCKIWKLSSYIQTICLIDIQITKMIQEQKPQREAFRLNEPKMKIFYLPPSP